MTLHAASRAIRRKPRHAWSILLILSAGLAAATVTFSVVDAVVLRPLPFERGEDLVLLSGRTPWWPTALSPEEFWAIHDRVGALDSLGSFRTTSGPVDVAGVVDDLRFAESTAEMFTVFRLRPLLGRVWTAAEEQRADLDLVVLGYALWQRRFGGDPAVLHRSIRIASKTYQVIGVMPPTPDYVATLGLSPDVWMARVPPRQGIAGGVSRTTLAIGRLKTPGSLDQLDEQVRTALAPLAASMPHAYKDWRPQIVRWQSALVGDAGGWMLLLLGAVALVVAIACVNAANLMLTRSLERSRELAVRASLGGSRRHLALMLLTESVMLSVAATLIGLLIAMWGVHAAKAALPVGIFRAAAIALNGRVLAMASCAAVATGLLFGAIPAWQASRASIVALLNQTSAQSTPRRRGWRSMLLVSQVACVGVLLVVSTLFVVSFVNVARADLGIDRTNLIGVSILSRSRGTLDDVRDRIAGVPGVTGVAGVTSSSLPLVGAAFGGAWATTRIRADGAHADRAIEMSLWRVTADYFDVAGARLLRGAPWRPERAAEERPVVLDQQAARQLFGGRDPIGAHVYGPDKADVYTVVGVAPVVRWRGAEYEPRATVYLPVLPQAKAAGASFFVRTSSSPAALAKTIGSAVDAASPGASVDVRLVDDALRRLTATRRFGAGLMSVFGLLAIAIGAAGIYAAVTALVAQQTHEIGVRMALGATGADIRLSVLTATGRYVILGLALGLSVAWWTARLFRTLLFQVQPTDVSTYVIVAALIAVAALAAAILPARRASRVDPLVSLRSA